MKYPMEPMKAVRLTGLPVAQQKGFVLQILHFGPPNREVYVIMYLFAINWT